MSIQALYQAIPTAVTETCALKMSGTTLTTSVLPVGKRGQTSLSQLTVVLPRSTPAPTTHLRSLLMGSSQTLLITFTRDSCALSLSTPQLQSLESSLSTPTTWGYWD